MQQNHAVSQMSDAEATRLLQATLVDLAQKTGEGTQHTAIEPLRGRAIGTRDMLGISEIKTPEGPMWMVRLSDIVDDESMGGEWQYSDRLDALTVWEHLVDEYENPQAAQ